MENLESAMNVEHTTVGGRMKRYEAVTKTFLLPHSYTVLRVDGRAFHSYLRNAEKPYDFKFMDDMVAVGVALCEEISGSVFAYGQSDEISVLMADLSPNSQPWFGGVVQKMASVAASVATLALVSRRGVEGKPGFDARVFTLPSRDEVTNYFLWRQRDAVRNSISMLAQSKFSPRELHGVNSDQAQEMLWSQHKINWDQVPTKAKRGWVVERAVREGPVTYHHKGTGEETTTVVKRNVWEPHAAPSFSWDSDFWDVLK